MPISINCSSGSLILCAFLLLIVPLQWILAAVAAALIHELFHYVMIRLSGNDVFEIAFTQHGMIMKTTSLSDLQELICALAGPIGSMLLVCCAPWIPRIAVCAGIQGVFNLLPVYPLDGGRILHSFAALCFSDEVAQSLCRCVMYGTCFLILLAGIFCSYRMKIGFMPLFASILFLSRVVSEKFLANRGN